jgi:hypothetical protein
VAALLGDAAVVFLGARRGDDFVAGAALNDSGDAVGVSNVFGPAAVSYPAAVAAASASYPGRTVVGWERSKELDAARAAGFNEVGAFGCGRAEHRRDRRDRLLGLGDAPLLDGIERLQRLFG